VFEETIHPNGQRLFSARIIPFRGSWVEFTLDIHDVVFVHIDKKKKFPATALLRAFGYSSNSDILGLFFAKKELDITGNLQARSQRREILGTLLAADVRNPEEPKGEPLAKEGDELTLETLHALRRAGVSTVSVFAGYTQLNLRDEDEAPQTLREREHRHVLAFDVADPGTGEVLAERGKELTETLRKRLRKAGVARLVRALVRARARVSRRGGGPRRRRYRCFPARDGPIDRPALAG
jgi:DNA-directed RNA polymerase subunit beta